MNHDPFESLQTSRVLFGEVDFPVVSLLEVPERGLSHAILRGFAMQSLACWNYADPTFLETRPPLRDYVNKTPLFAAQAVLNCKEGAALRTKEDYTAFLETFGGVEIINPTNGPWQNAKVVCHNAALLLRVLETCAGKEFENVPMDMAQSPNRIQLDYSGLISDDIVHLPHLMYSS